MFDSASSASQANSLWICWGFSRSRDHEQIAKLILINGPPGIGKSTLARRYIDDHPLSLCVDIDAIRVSLGCWSEHAESKRLARVLGAEMARVHLAAGHDVVVPQLLGNTQFVETLASLAADTSADFQEIVLLDTREEALRRFHARQAELRAAGTSHPQDEIPPEREEEALNYSYDAMLRISEERPKTRVVLTTSGNIDEAYDSLCQALGDRPGSQA